MLDSKVDNSYVFYDLEWDTSFFGITSAKVILNKPLMRNEWLSLKTKCSKYQFISIVNRYSEPVNAQIIGKDTTAFLADVNIQFSKKIEGSLEISDSIVIAQSLEKIDSILELAQFHYSKFTEDPELLKRGGDQVYIQWLQNSFNRQDKFFALAKNSTGNITGFLLHSYSGNTCEIELIAVSSKEPRSGIGSALFKAVEYSAFQFGCNEINVGTQVRNVTAINFYRKLGLKQTGAHQVFHMWNL